MPEETDASARRPTSKMEQARKTANDQDAMTLTELARAILGRKIRPRVAQVRRLAEAVLAAEEAMEAKPKPKPEADGKKAKKAKTPKSAKKPADKKKKGRKKKLAKIPARNA